MDNTNEINRLREQNRRLLVLLNSVINMAARTTLLLQIKSNKVQIEQLRNK